MADVDIQTLDAEIIFSEADPVAPGGDAMAEPVAGEMDRLRALIEPLVLEILAEHYDGLKRMGGG